MSDIISVFAGVLIYVITVTKDIATSEYTEIWKYVNFIALSAKLNALDEADSVVPNSKITQTQHHFFQFSTIMKAPGGGAIWN